MGHAGEKSAEKKMNGPTTTIPTCRDPPCNLSENEIYELTHRLKPRMFTFGKETAKKLVRVGGGQKRPA